MVRAVAVCRCPRCQRQEDHPDRILHHQMNVLMSRLDEAQRRWFAGVESRRIGDGGDVRLSLITGLDEKTIRRGRDELAASLAACPTDAIRRVGGGRPPREKKIRG